MCVGYLTKQFHHLPAAVAVQRRRRFVGQNHARLVGQRASDRHALLLSPGKHGRGVIGTVTHAEAIQQLDRAVACPARAQAIQFQCDLNIL